MNQQTLRSVVAIVIILLIAVGLAWAGSQGGTGAFGTSLFAVCVALAFVIQWVVFIPAFVYQTEKYFDLTGSITYVTVMTVALVLNPQRDITSFLLYGLVVLWAVRLGTFLFRRVRAAGEDRRFRDLKPSFARFLVVWTIQGLWVSFTLAAALAAVTSESRPATAGFAVVGVLVWLAGFGIEVMADRQKSQFRAVPANKGKFINVGLWSWSRHPNYFGEIVLWIGVAIIAFPALSGWQLLTLISPIFVIVLLTRISGIPLLEKGADERWGGQADYEQYKARTSILIPLPPRSE